ncbi:Lamin Tail Domain protein [uncultured archaeon]|nr:Lamin Tail Domain protein [uncultured archaeon]
MKKEYALLLLAVLMTFSPGIALAEDALNSTNATSALNITNSTNAASVVAPQETASRFMQLSNETQGKVEVLGKSLESKYSDVTEVADTNAIFSREAGATTPSVKVAITNVNAEGDKYVQITNQAVGSWDFTGWKLVSAENATFTFPEFVLDNGASVKVHEGSGSGTKADLYTNSTAPLWIDQEVSLQNADGYTISIYDITAAPKETVLVNPLAKNIQY